jgi:hypothetical protein
VSRPGLPNRHGSVEEDPAIVEVLFRNDALSKKFLGFLCLEKDLATHAKDDA